jgi:hypothetical protein
MSNPVAFDDLIETLTQLESTEFLEELAKEMGSKVDELVRDGFSKATDPYGDPWAPRKLARGRVTPPHLPLRKTDTMHDSFHVESNAAGLKVTNPVVYTPFQNDGTRFIDARGMVPDDRGLGEWEDPLRKVAQQVFNSKLNGEG